MKHLYFFLILLFASGSAFAKTNFDVAIGQQTYSGKDEESLAPGTGLVLRLGAQSGEGIFRWTTGLYVVQSSGEAEFNDAGTTRELEYQMRGGEFSLGFVAYPLGGQSKLSLQPYLSAGGVAHLASISFDKDAAVSDTFPKSDSSMMFGYSLAVGADLSFGKDWGGKIQIERTQVSGQLAENTFGLSGQRIMLGLYFR